jgi:putative ABC transport system permease protein
MKVKERRGSLLSHWFKQPNNAKAAPPMLARLVLYLALPDKVYACIRGDLDEEYYTLILPRIGLQLAKRWYWQQVLRSIGPTLRGELASTGIRSSRKENLLETFWHDLRYGLRLLTKQPSFTLVAIIALALGIGANTAVFSVVNTVLLRPLPYAEPDRIVSVSESNLPKGINQFPVSPANFLDWQEQNQVFEQIAVTARWTPGLSATGEPERLNGARVSASLFNLLGIRPVVGRGFLPDDEKTPSQPVVVISHDLWQRHFGADPKMVGRTILLDGVNFVVVGVMPPSIQYPGRSDVWTTPAFPPSYNTARGAHYLWAIARLKPGVSLEKSQAQMNTIAGRLEQQYPDNNKDWGVSVQPLYDDIVGEVRPALLILLGAVGFVLLIACANVANLLLARAAGRQKEIALRAGLGASRGRIIRQLLTESLPLSVIGGGLGLLLAFWGTKSLLALSPNSMPRSREFAIDGLVLSFTLLISLLTGVAFSIIPALQSSKPNVSETLKATSWGPSRGHQRIRNLLTISEIALSLVLLIGAGLLIKSFLRLQQENLGFKPSNILTAPLSLTEAKYRSSEEQIIFFQQLLTQVKALPGVQSVGATTTVPSAIDFTYGFEIEGRPPTAQDALPSAKFYVITPDYFQVMSIPVLHGRAFTGQDVSGTARVAIINEPMARQYFPNENPIGKRINITDGPPTMREIVGIVPDIKQFGLDQATPPQIYEPYFQNPFSSMSLVVRTTNSPTSLAAALRSAVRSVDQDQPISNVKTLEQVLADSIANRTFSLILFGTFAVIALVLATVGIYGVISFLVAQRFREIGLRLTLGAERSDVLKLVVGQGVVLGAVGVTLGLLASLALAKGLGSFSELLYKVSATDPAVFSMVPLVLFIVAALACLLPAWQATKLDPTMALRGE